MNPKEINTENKKRKLYRKLLNKYLISAIVFIVWMLFFDQNSYMIHRELDKQIRELKHDRKSYSEKLEKEKARIEEMKSDSTEIERVARERHYLKKKDEDIFIIEEKKVKKQVEETSKK